MSTRGFIFSLDSFVAFTLALIAIYTLIFFSSIPYGYYSALMQAHYLAEDSITALSLSTGQTVGLSKLDYIVLNHNYAATPDYLDSVIPNQFGYSLESYDSNTKSWSAIYNTATDSNSKHNKVYKKLRTSSYSLVFNYKTSSDLLDSKNPFGYLTCKGELTQCNPPESSYERANSGMALVRLTVYI